MKGYFFEGDMELTKEWVCKKVDYLYQEHLGISTLLLIKKKYGELRRQSIEALETKIFP